MEARFGSLWIVSPPGLRPLRRIVRSGAALALLAALPLPLSASLQEAGAEEDGADAAQYGPPPTDAFLAQFEDLIDPSEPAAESPIDPDALFLPEDAVDLTAFPPPQGPQVLRDLGTGVASYYGQRFHGRRTASGEIFDMGAMTAAHRTLPFGSYVRVTNPRTGQSVIVRINDRGPFIAGRSIDLSRAAAEEIGMIAAGHAPVQMELIAP